MTYTPGPWRFSYGEVYTEWTQIKGASRCHLLICDVASYRENATANGSLVAAAPELSAVCKDKLGLYESPANTLRAIAETFDEKTPWHMWLLRKAAQMDAAIAKAEGKQ